MDDKELEEIVDLEDEIIDMEDDSVSEIEVPEESVVESPITKRGNDYNPFAKGRMFNSDKTTPSKLQNLGNKNRSIPPLGGSSFSNSETEEKEDTLKDKVQDKAVGKALTAATGGAVNGEVAEKIATVARKSGLLENASFFKKYKIYIIAALSAFIVLFLLIFLIMIGSADDTEMNMDGQSYINGSMTEEELANQLIYYGYCNTESECKSKGIYKYYKKLKEVSNEYSKECNGDPTMDKVCDLQINTALIIETMNYYDNSIASFDSKETGTTEADVEASKGQSIFSKISDYFKNQKRIDTMVSDVEDLAKAQAEYVHEVCYVKTKDTKTGKEVKKKKNMYYYQLSMDKYTSYLMYGNTSTHPNYSGKAKEVENDECVGPKNDAVLTSFGSSENGSNSAIAGSGRGAEIVNDALQYVGNPYVWGGTSLTNGIDCSGFTQAIYGHFGISLPHSSRSQYQAALNAGGVSVGTNVEDIANAQPGDLIVWAGHVGIYYGNGQMVNALGKKYGIVVSKAASSHQFLGIVRF